MRLMGVKLEDDKDTRLHWAQDRVMDDYDELLKLKDKVIQSQKEKIKLLEEGQ